MPASVPVRDSGGNAWSGAYISIFPASKGCSIGCADQKRERGSVLHEVITLECHSQSHHSFYLLTSQNILNVTSSSHTAIHFTQHSLNRSHGRKHREEQ